MRRTYPNFGTRRQDLMAIDFTRSRYPEPADSVGYLLYQLAGLWRQQMNARLSDAGLTYIQFIFLIGLAWLGRNGDDVTQKDLKLYHKAGRALTSQVVRLLERDGLIVQTAKPGDARARLLKLTKEGTKRVKQAMPMLDQNEQAFLAEHAELKRSVKRDLRAALGYELEKISTEAIEVDAE
jgi:DNA-binding MarR family transcriptional regulator